MYTPTDPDAIRYRACPNFADNRLTLLAFLCYFDEKSSIRLKRHFPGEKRHDRF
jgi:hypothetical protein